MKKFLTLLVLPMFTLAVRGDVESGPKAGDKVGELKVHAVVGPIEGKEVDYAAERKELPTVYFFVNSEKFDRPMARVFKVLDGKYADADEKALGVLVWLGDVDMAKRRLPAINGSLKFEKTALTAFAEKSGPNGWGINPDAHLTIVVAHKGKVVKSFPFTSVNEKDSDAVLMELKKAVGK